MIKEDLPKISGKGMYIDDLNPMSTVYLGIVRSPIARGIIKSISKPEKSSAHSNMGRCEDLHASKS